MNKLIRVMLVEDNPEYRDVIKLALDDVVDIELTSQFGTSEIAIRPLTDSSSGQVAEAPDLILLDIRLPGMDGLVAIPAFRRCAPDAKIIILTQSDQERDVVRAISAGATGYLLKSSTLVELTSGIRTVANGGASLDAGVAKYILTSLQTRIPEEFQDQLLSERELEILSLLAEGCVKKEVAKRLKIGYTTVDTHVGRIYAKLDVSNAPSAVNRAHRLKLFPPEGF